MCRGCWSEMGEPAHRNDRVRAAALSVARLYEVHGAGGGMHIVTDDWNLEDSSLDFCEHQRELDDRERRVLHALRDLTFKERGAALAMWEGFVEDPVYDEMLALERALDED